MHQEMIEKFRMAFNMDNIHFYKKLDSCKYEYHKAVFFYQKKSVVTISLFDDDSYQVNFYSSGLLHVNPTAIFESIMHSYDEYDIRVGGLYFHPIFYFFHNWIARDCESNQDELPYIEILKIVFMMGWRVEEIENSTGETITAHQKMEWKKGMTSNA